MGSFQDLPLEVMLIIITFLPMDSVFTVATLCRTLRSLSEKRLRDEYNGIKGVMHPNRRGQLEDGYRGREVLQMLQILPSLQYYIKQLRPRLVGAAANLDERTQEFFKNTPWLEDGDKEKYQNEQGICDALLLTCLPNLRTLDVFLDGDSSCIFRMIHEISKSVINARVHPDEPHSCPEPRWCALTRNFPLGGLKKLIINLQTRKQTDDNWWLVGAGLLPHLRELELRNVGCARTWLLPTELQFPYVIKFTYDEFKFSSHAAHAKPFLDLVACLPRMTSLTIQNMNHEGWNKILTELQASIGHRLTELKLHVGAGLGAFLLKVKLHDFIVLERIELSFAHLVRRIMSERGADDSVEFVESMRATKLVTMLPPSVGFVDIWIPTRHKWTWQFVNHEQAYLTAHAKALKAAARVLGDLPAKQGSHLPDLKLMRLGHLATLEKNAAQTKLIDFATHLCLDKMEICFGTYERDFDERV